MSIIFLVKLWDWIRSKSMQELKIGMEVRLNVEENIRLHGAMGIVKEITHYGAIISTLAAATGQFRAMRDEIVIEHQIVNGGGYTGNCCPQCGSTKMRRVGTCETCQECGSSTGC